MQIIGEIARQQGCGMSSINAGINNNNNNVAMATAKAAL